MKPTEMERLAEIVAIKYALFKKTNKDVRGKKLQEQFFEIINNVYINQNVYEVLGIRKKTFLIKLVKINNKKEVRLKILTPQEIEKNEATKKFLRKTRKEAKIREKEFLAEQQLLGRDNDGDPPEKA